MPNTKQKVLAYQHSLPNDLTSDVSTLDETAAYLRFAPAAVPRLVEEQSLPARHLGEEWRLFRTAIQQWLSAPAPRPTLA